MKITRSKLKQIIKEELVAEYGRPCGADNEADGGFSGPMTAEPAA